MESSESSKELRTVTILFADISGFTKLAEKLEPEEAAEILEEIFSLIDRIVVDYGGRIDKHEGDRVMVTFGLPVARADDMKRALNSSLKIKKEIEDFSNKRGVEIGVHIGINAGKVLCGEIGSNYKKEFTVIGDAVNIAARLTEMAPKNSIYLSEVIFKALKDSFNFKEVGSTYLKGREKPIKIYELLSEKIEIQKIFVNRERELLRLKNALNKLKSGDSQFVIIIGEPGIGKSALIEKFLENNDLIKVKGEIKSYGRGKTFAPLQDFINSIMGDNIESKVKEIFGDRWRDILPYILFFAGKEIPEGLQMKIKYLPPESKRLKVFLSLRDLFIELSKEKPIVFAISDFHEADEGTISFLKLLIRDLKRMRVMLIFETRREMSKDVEDFLNMLRLSYRDYLTEIELMPLSPQCSIELIRKRAPHLTESSIEMIIKKAKGNPLFIEELTKGEWKEIPLTLQAVVMARIDRIEKEIAKILEIASLIGEQFDVRIIEKITGSYEEVKKAMDYAQYAELIQKETKTKYRFKHEIIKDVLESRILKRRKRELHFKIAEAIKSLFYHELEKYYEMLAYHYAESGDYRKAADYLEMAADNLAEINQSETAINYYEKALKLIEECAQKS